MDNNTMYNKVYGCWIGKNIGGTLGGPLEGKMELMNHTFYTQDFGGTPIDIEQGDPYLPAYHRVCPDAKVTTEAGKHNIKIEVTAANTETPFDVAFQAVDHSCVFDKKRGLLQDDILTSFDAK